MMKRLYFVRHGESELNKANRMSGLSDTPLTEKGHQQARQAGLAAKKQGLAFDMIIASPLQRAHNTAKHFAAATNYPPERIEIHPRLVERNFGELEGTKDLIVTTKYFLDESAIDDYKDVESLAELQKRADEMLAYLRDLPHDTILVVSHGAFGRALRRAVNDEPIGHRGKSFGNAEIARLI